jgi:ketosteroid isomerase-like protein
MRAVLCGLAGLVAGGLLTSTVFVAQQRLADDETRAAVIAVKRAIVEGHRMRDAKGLSALYADDYLAIDSTGAVRTKADLLAALPTDPEMRDGRYDLIAVRRWGNLAVASGRGHLVYRNPDGSSRVSDYYSFNVFEQRDGKWLYVSAFLP